MGLTLGLLTAVAWGASDFLARFVARRIGSFRTTLYMQFIGLVLLTIFLPRVGGWGHLFDGSGWQPWAWGVLAGTFNAVASLALYRSFEFGKMSIVAPISASYPALTIILSFFSGERLTPARFAGVALIVIGVVLVARGEASGITAEAASHGDAGNPTVRAVRNNGIGWAFASAVGFGILFWLLGTRVVPAVGYAATVWMIRLTSSIFTVGVILTARQQLVPSKDMSITGLLLAMGILDTGAFVLNNRGMQLEQVSVVSVLASLYGAITVLLAAAFLRERLTRWQWLGVAAIFTGIVAISR
jgi:drug/metabolite transporter (DMT)-like permease